MVCANAHATAAAANTSVPPRTTGYFLPTILTTLGLIFYDAWQLSAVTEEEGRAKFFTQIFRTYSSVLFCCAAGIIWLCRPVMHIMKANYYYA